VISGWQETYLSNSDHLSVGCVPGDTSTPDPSSVVGYEHGRPYQGPPELFTADGGAPRGISAGGAGAGGVGGGVGVGGADDVGAGGADDTSVGWEWCSPFTGYARSGGGDCQRWAAGC
jgi:hypothetical protein